MLPRITACCHLPLNPHVITSMFFLPHHSLTDHVNYFQNSPIMYSKAEYLALKVIMKRTPEEQARLKNMQEERRRFLKAEAMRIKRAGSTEQEKNNERDRTRKQRAKLTSEEAAAATKRNTELRRQARARAAAGDDGEMLVVEVSESGEVLSQETVRAGPGEDVALPLEVGSARAQVDVGELSLQPDHLAERSVTEEPPFVPVSGEAVPVPEVASVILGSDSRKLCLYEQIRARNIAEREHAWKEHVKNGKY